VPLGQSVMHIRETPSVRISNLGRELPGPRDGVQSDLSTVGLMDGNGRKQRPWKHLVSSGGEAVTAGARAGYRPGKAAIDRNGPLWECAIWRPLMFRMLAVPSPPF
jgi:hypothetical protein